MMLGVYTFAWLPDAMEIPRPGKAIAVKNNLGGAACLSWEPMVLGERVKLSWDLMPVAQYDALRSIHLAGEVVAWSLPTDGAMVPTGSSLSTYNVKVLSLAAKFLDVVDYDMPYRKEVEMILLVRE